MVPRGIKPKEFRQLLQRVERLGCEVVLTRGNHVKVTTPSGGHVIASYTMSDPRGMKNLISELRKRGIEL